MELYSSEIVRQQTYGSLAYTLDDDTCPGFQPAWVIYALPFHSLLSASYTQALQVNSREAVGGIMIYAFGDLSTCVIMIFGVNEPPATPVVSPWSVDFCNPLAGYEPCWLVRGARCLPSPRHQTLILEHRE